MFFQFILILLMLFVVQGCSIPMEAKPTTTDILPKACLQILETSPVEMVLSQATVQNPPLPNTSAALLPSPPSPSSPASTQYLDEFSSCGAVLLSQKLRNLELQTRETDTTEMRRLALDPTCLLTPPNTPHTIDHVQLEKADQDKRMKVDSETLPWSSGVDTHDEGIERHYHSWFSSACLLENEIKCPLFSP